MQAFSELSGLTGNRTRPFQSRRGRHTIAVSSLWTMSPFLLSLVVSGPDGSRTHRTDRARISRLHRHAGPITEVRLGIEPSLPPYHSGVPPKHLQTSRVIPDGVEPSSPACHTGVVAVGLRDLFALSPSFLPPHHGSFELS